MYLTLNYSSTLSRNENDTGIESALKRFKREVSKAGIFQDMRKKPHFETPIEKEKRKAIVRHKQRRNQHSRFS
ncbi:30S ribosomal protein S21 [Nostoc sp.]|uniref:30S ribosomal protein S21 n=1 Tax=Nostoc sp. TaxID=1180 RepID=UPI002FFD1BA3